MKRSVGFLPVHVRTYLRFLLFALLVFGLYRVLLFGLEYQRAGEAGWGLISQAFIMGLRFDVVIACYILLLPFFLSTLHNLGLRNRLLRMLTRTVLYGGFAGAFIVSAIDIPYFRQFFDRITVAVFSWKESAGFMFNMVIQEARYVLFAIPMALVLIAFIRFARRHDQGLFSPVRHGRLRVGILSILCLGLIVLGIRGRIEKKSPIRIGTAYFSNNAFLNKLGLNPNFTLIRTALDEAENEERSALIDPSEAFERIRTELELQDDQLVRNIGGDASERYNVILVLMESMSADKLGRHGNPKELTPYLDSMAGEGIYFQQAYATGIHTFNGVYSSLFGLPSYYRRHPMKGMPKSYASGLYPSLRPHGYSTAYFTTHDGQFDNIEGFLKANACQLVVSSKDYPDDAIQSALGVTDDYMFQYAIPYLDELAAEGPFAATFMTASDHGPYVIPDDFECRNPNEMDCIVEFADYSIRHFMNSIKDKSWYGSTLFVFVADHGVSMSSTYDISLAYTHVPLLFYSPSLIDSAYTSNGMASQIDIYPTIMGLLDLPYTDHSLGLNLLEKQRKYAVFCYDDKLGVIDSNWFFYQRADGYTGLYDHPRRRTDNQLEAFPSQAKDMERYGRSLLEVYMDRLEYDR